MNKRFLDFFTIACTCVLFLSWTPKAAAINWGKLVRLGGKLADDVPVNRADEVAAALSRSPGLSSKVDDILRKTDGIDSKLPRKGRMRQALARAIDDLPADDLNAWLKAAPSQQEAAVVLAHGAKRLRSTVPDALARSDLIKTGGADVVAAIGKHDDLVNDFVRFHNVGTIATPGGRILTVNHLGEFVLVEGNRAQRFWSTYVRPHWKLWATGTALGAIMVAPDEYLDELGNITKLGMEKLIKFLTAPLIGAIEGIGEGTRDAVQDTVEAISRPFFTSGWGIFTLCLGLVVVFSVVPVLRGLTSAAISRVIPKRNPATTEEKISSDSGQADTPAPPSSRSTAADLTPEKVESTATDQETPASEEESPANEEETSSSDGTSEASDTDSNPDQST